MFMFFNKYSWFDNLSQKVKLKKWIWFQDCSSLCCCWRKHWCHQVFGGTRCQRQHQRHWWRYSIWSCSRGRRRRGCCSSRARARAGARARARVIISLMVRVVRARAGAGDDARSCAGDGFLAQFYKSRIFKFLQILIIFQIFWFFWNYVIFIRFWIFEGEWRIGQRVWLDRTRLLGQRKGLIGHIIYISRSFSGHFILWFFLIFFDI